MSTDIALSHRLVRQSIIPGFRLTLICTLVYLTLIVLIPLVEMLLKTATMSFSDFINLMTSERVLHAFAISFGTSFIAALINVFFGFIVAWVLVRYRFLGRKSMNAMVDLPFALPTAVAGIAMTALYTPQGWIGQFLMPLKVKIAFTPLGIIIAMIFVGLPFVVRAIQPALETIKKETEEAAATLGATPWQIFIRLIVPQTLPAILTGFTMAFARALGEYGAVIFIAGNIPGFSEIVPLVIVIKLNQSDDMGATAIASVMLVISFILLFVIYRLQNWNAFRRGKNEKYE